MKARSISVIGLALMTLPLLGAGAPQPSGLADENPTEILFGPVRFIRETGKPSIAEVDVAGPDFEHFQPPFVLHVLNGGTDKKDLVSSASITLDGIEIFSPSSFSKQVQELVAEVTLSKGSILQVGLQSKPGSYLTIWIDGALKQGRAMVGPEGGQLVSADGIALLDVPEGAVTSPTILSIETSDVDPDPILDPYFRDAVSPIIDLGPDGFEFLLPATVTVSYSDDDVSSGASEDTAMLLEVLPSGVVLDVGPFEVDTDANLLRTELSHFTWLVAAFAKTPGIYLSGPIWNTNTIKFFIGPDTDQEWVWGGREDIVRGAIMSWWGHQDRFGFEEVWDPEDANMVLWVGTEEQCSLPFWGPCGGTACTHWPTWLTVEMPNPLYGDQIDICFVSSQANWESWYSNPYALRASVQHEVGHFVGLGHNPSPASARWPVYRPIMYTEAGTNAHISGDDIASIEEKYGVPYWRPGAHLAFDNGGDAYFDEGVTPALFDGWGEATIGDMNQFLDLVTMDVRIDGDRVFECGTSSSCRTSWQPIAGPPQYEEYNSVWIYQMPWLGPGTHTVEYVRGHLDEYWGMTSTITIHVR